MSRPYEGKNKLKNHKHEMFARLYSATRNGVQSAIKAGLGGTYGSSAQHAGVLLKDAQVKLRIDYLIALKMEKVEAQCGGLIDELASISFGKITDIVNVNKSGTDFKLKQDGLDKYGGIISEISIQKGKSPKKTVKLHNKLDAIEKLMRFHEMYDQGKEAREAEKHAAWMANAGIEQVEVEDDGFMEAMNDVADNMETDEFVITEGKDDKKEGDKDE